MLAWSDFHGAACNCFSQHSCTEGKKSCWNCWTWPNLALPSKIQNNRVCRNKTKKLIYVATIVSLFLTRLQEMWQRCAGLCNFDVSRWQNPPLETWWILKVCPTLTTSTCTSTISTNRRHWCHISKVVTEDYRAGFPSFVLGINLVSAGSCADLMAWE